MRKRMIPLLLAVCLTLTACGTKKAETPEFDFQAETASLSELRAESNEARREAVDARSTRRLFCPTLWRTERRLDC